MAVHKVTHVTSPPYETSDVTCVCVSRAEDSKSENEINLSAYQTSAARSSSLLQASGFEVTLAAASITNRNL